MSDRGVSIEIAAERFPISYDGGAGDVFGLMHHDHLRESSAQATFSMLDATVQAIIQNDPGVTKAYIVSAPDECVDVAHLHPTPHHALLLSRSEAHGGTRVTYTLARTDMGGPGNGFHFMQTSDGAVFVRSQDHETFDPNSDRYVQALQQIQELIKAIAYEYNVPLPAQRPEPEDPVSFRERVTKNYKRQNSIMGKTRRAAALAGNTAIDVGRRIVTRKTELGDRQISWGRLAVLAAVLPVPGYSSRLVEDAPFPRPASVETLSNMAHAIFDEEPPTAEEVKRKQYQQGSDNLPVAALLSPDGISRDILVISGLSGEVTRNAAVIDVASYADEVTVGGYAPVKLVLDGELLTGECMNVGMEQSGNYSVLGMTEADTDNLSVAASGDSIKLCNTKPGMIILDGRVLFIDAYSDKKG